MVGKQNLLSLGPEHILSCLRLHILQPSLLLHSRVLVDEHHWHTAVPVKLHHYTNEIVVERFRGLFVPQAVLLLEVCDSSHVTFVDCSIMRPRYLHCQIALTDK